MRNKLAAISLNSEKRPNYSVKAFIAQPDPLQENLGGRLFALIEIAAKKSDAEKIIDFIINDLDFNYYQDEKLSLREKISGLRIENIFETVLVKTNKNLIDFLEKEKIRLSSNDISATLGVAYGDEIHFSSNGSNQAFLLYRKDDGTYRTTDIATGEPETTGGISKLFTALISGTIPSKSYFIAANEPLSEYLHNEDLIEIITKLPPSSAAEQIKNIMAEMNAYVSFAGLIVKNTASEEPQEVNYSIQAPVRETVVTDLLASETATERILASKSSLDAQQISDISEKMIKKINFFPWLIGRLKSLIPKKRVISQASLPIDGSQYEKAPDKTKRLLLMAIAGIILVFAINIIIIKVRQSNNGENGNSSVQSKDWEAQLSQKQSKVDNYLLYGNEAEAKTTLEEFKGLLEQFASKYSEEPKYSEFKIKYEEQLAQVERVVDFSNPSEIANFSSLNPNASVNSLELTNGRLYAAGDSAEIYKLTVKDNLLKAIDSKSSSLKNPTIDKNGVIRYLDGQKNVIAIDTKTDSISSSKVALKDGQEIVGIDTYLDKYLYTLDKANKQLYRFTKGVNGYERGETRLKGDDLGSAVALYIDNRSAKSYVYVLKSDGQLLKFYDGKQESFSLKAIDPALSSVSKMVIAKNIYILSNDSRVAVFSAEGEFKHQYRFSGVSDLKDIAVDEAAGKLYLLSGTSIKSVDLIK